MASMIRTALDNWKTTSAGLLSIAGGLTGLGYAIYHRAVTQGEIMATVTAVLGGIGLIHAGDASKSKSDLQDAKTDAAEAIDTGDTSILKNPVAPLETKTP